MAIDIVKLTRNRVIAAAAETTSGTAATLGASASGLFNAIFSPNFRPSIPTNRRQGQVTLSQIAPVPGAQAMKATWQSELFGSGVTLTAPSYANILFAACGCSVSAGVVTPFTPTNSTGLTTATIGLYQSGQLFEGAGCAGTFTITGEVGKPAMIDWDFDGAWVAPTDTAVPSGITWPTVKPPACLSATISVGSLSGPRIKQWKFTAGVKVYLREDMTAASGYRAGIVVEREPTITLDPEMQSLATVNWFSGQTAGTTYAFSCAIGSASGNTMTLAAPVAQLVEAPQIGDRNGVVTNPITLLCTRNAAAGDDEWSLTYS